MTKEEKLEIINKRCPYNVYNGINAVDIGEDFCVIEGELKNETLNPWGMAHGGFVYSLCDVASGVVVGIGGRTGVTLSSNMHYFHPSKGSRLRAEGRIVKDGKNVVVVETLVFDGSGTLTAKGSFEIFIVSNTNGGAK